MTRSSRGGRRYRILLIAVGVLVLLWCAYWFASNQIAAAAAGKVVAALAAGGRDVACTENVTGGFPLSLDLECGQVTFNDENAGMAVALSRVVATAPLYQPGSFDAEIAGPMTLDASVAGGSVDAEWERAVAHAEAGFSGLNRVNVELDTLLLRPKSGPVAQRFTEIAAERAQALAEPADGDAYRFVVLADRVLAKPVAGPDMPILGAMMDVTARDFGSSLGLDPGRTVRAWAARGGTIDVRQVAAVFGGASAVASGALELSSDGLLSGTLTLRLRGLEALPAAIEAVRPGAGDKVAQLVGAAAMFTKPVPGDDGAREAPLVIEDSVVMIGVIPVATIPPLTF